MSLWTWCNKCGERVRWEETHRDDEFIYYKCPNCGNVAAVPIKKPSKVSFGVRHGLSSAGQADESPEK